MAAKSKIWFDYSVSSFESLNVYLGPVDVCRDSKGKISFLEVTGSHVNNLVCYRDVQWQLEQIQATQTGRSFTTIARN